MGRLLFEFTTCRNDARRLARGPGDVTERVAYLEGTLLHARVLHEFLTRDETRTCRKDDVLRIDFARAWAIKEDADKDVRATARRLTHTVKLANRHLAHLTWTRASTAKAVKGPDNIEWLFVQMVVDLATVLAAWVRHAIAEMPDPLETLLLADRRHPALADTLLEECELALDEFNAILDAHREQTTGTTRI